MHINGLFKDYPPHQYFPKDYSEELGLIEPDQNEVRLSSTQWKTQATFLMLAFALVLWIFTYLLIMAITMCFDKNFRAVGSITESIQWYNFTTYGKIPIANF